MKKRFLFIGCLFAMLSVIIGAFAAHGLKPQLSEYQIGIFETGVEYQFYHAFAILIVALLSNHLPSRLVSSVGWLFVAGIICFSGSLYLMATKELTGLDLPILGPITPIGGTLFIIGWAVLMFGATKLKAE